MHVLSVVFWIGGVVFSAFVAGPLLGGKHAVEGGHALLERMVQRFQRFSRELVLLIIVTGIFNVVNRGLLIEFNFSSNYLIVLGTKVTILLTIVCLQVFYSLKVIPGLAEALAAGNDDLPGHQKKAFWTACSMAVLGACAIFMGLNLGYL